MIAVAERESTYQDREAIRHRNRRAASRDLSLPPCLNPKRRQECSQDIYLALATYFPHRFSQEFTPSRREMVDAVFGAMRDGTAQAIAAPRGDGKTTITECVVTLCVLYGWIRFPLILAQTAEYAGDRLEGIKREIETNNLLAEDFPEVCIPARDVATAPQRCASQTVNGELTHMRWSGDTIILPTIPGSECSGSVVRARGITGSLRGMNVNGMRPDLVIIDDPDDEESADSETKTARRVKKINQSIDGLAQDGKPLAQVMLCTLINRTCVAYQYTDRQQNPAWNGKRFRAIETMPERVDLWEEYVRLRQEDQQGGDRFARRSHQFVLDRWDEMHAGAVVGNPLAFDDTPLEDGTLREASRLQHCYNIIAKIGWNSFATEYQNDPPEDDGPQSSGITEAIVAGTDPQYMGRVNGRERLIAPDGTTTVVGFVDVHKRHLEWTLLAIRPGNRDCIVDYGVTSTHQPDVVGEEGAILGGLRELRDMFAAEPVRSADGESFPLAVCLVDCGYQPEAVYRFCRESGEPIQAAREADGRQAAWRRLVVLVAGQIGCCRSDLGGEP